MAVKPAPDGPTLPAGALNAEITRAAVRVYRAFRGRGPTRARTMFRHDVVVVVLEDVMTVAERSLVATGRGDEALAARRALQEAMRPALTDVVRDLTRAAVLAVMSDSHLDPDISVEIFALDRPVDPGDSAVVEGFASDPAAAGVENGNGPAAIRPTTSAPRRSTVPRQVA
jgi:uncharacterized protein YbcI